MLTQAQVTANQQGTVDAILSGVSAVGNAALEAGAAYRDPTAVFTKAGRKKLKAEAALTGSSLSELSQPFGLWQDVLGAGAKDVQQRGLGAVLGEFAAVDPLHPSLGGNKNLSELATRVRDVLNGSPKNWAKGLAEINKTHMIFNPQMLEEIRAGKPGAVANVAGWLRDNPLGNMVASLGVEWWNPGGRIAGRVMQHVIPPVARVLKKAVPADIKQNLGRKFNLYHDVQQPGTPPGLLDWRLRRGASEAQVKAHYHDLRNQIFGPSLTREQKYELQARMEGTAPNLVAQHLRNDPDYVTPEPVKGPTLDERAEALRRLSTGLDARMRATDPTLLPHETGTPFFSRAGTKREPVWELDPPEIPGGRQGGRGGGPLGAPKGARATGEREYPTLYAGLEAGQRLAKSYDPARQFERTFMDRELAISATEGQRGLEQIPVADGAQPPGGVGPVKPLMAREPYRYYLDKNGVRQSFEDEGAAHRYAGREASRDAAATLHKARDAKGLPPLPPPPRISTSQAFGRFMQSGREAKLWDRKGASLGRQAERVSAKHTTTPEDAAAPFVDALKPLTREAKNLEGTLNENLSAASLAKATAQSADEGQAFFRQQIAELEPHATTTTQRAILEQAQHLRDEEMAAEGPIRQVVGPRSIKPSWVWNGPQKGWGLAGEFEDLRGSRFLDLSNKPKMAPAQTAGLVARVDGNLDDVAGVVSSATGQEMTTDQLVQWMGERRRDPSVASYIEAARRRLEGAVQGNRAQALEQAGFDPATPVPEAIRRLRKDEENLKTLAASSRTEATQRKFAEQTIGPAARATVGAAERMQPKIEKLATDVAERQAAAAGSTAKMAKQVQDEAGESQARFAAARARWQKVKADQLERRKFYSAVGTLARHYEAQIFKTLEHPPESVPRGTYLRESDLGLGIPGGDANLIHKDAYNSLAEAKKLAKSAKDADEMTEAWKFFLATGRFARAGIILWPTVHAVWNLGRAFLEEAGAGGIMRLNRAGGPMSAATAARLGVKAGTRWDEFGTQVGAIDDFHQEGFGLAPEANATLRTSPYSELSTRGKIDKMASEGVRLPPSLGGKKIFPGWDDNQWLVFHVFERRYASELLRHYIEDEGADTAAATLRVRDAMRKTNITAFEKNAFPPSLLLFYPWMKTVVPYWTKRAFFNPNSWNAPVTALRQEREDMNDPEADYVTNNWTLDAWKNDDGTFERLPVPDPARVTGAVADLGRIPIDFFRGETSRNRYGQPERHQGLGVIPDDTKRALTYLTGHVAPLPALAMGALGLGNRYQQLISDPREDLGAQGSDVAARLRDALLAPATRFSQFAADPKGAALGFAVGVPPYKSVPLNPTRAQTRATHIKAHFAHLIALARKRDDDAAVARLQAELATALKNIASPQPPPPVAPTQSVDQLLQGVGQ